MDVEIRYEDNLKGKSLFAKRDFKKGEVIFDEDPLVCCQFSWNEAYSYKACDHCLRPLETAEENARRLTGQNTLILPYKECCSVDKSKSVTCTACSVEYCSEECCKKAFEEYHSTLCIRSSIPEPNHPLVQLNEAWKQCHYPPETNSVMLLTRLMARILQSPNRELAIAQTLQFCHRTVNEDADLAHKLLGEKFSNQLSLLHELFIKTVPNEGIEQFLTLEGFQSLLALIGTNGQGVGTSSISQWVSKVTQLSLPENEKKAIDKFIDKLYEDMEEASGSFLDNEGVALYCLQSTCNHSCMPNAECTFLYNNSRLSLKALKDVQAGEEILISYLDECNLQRSRHSRRKYLMDYYLFLCNCEKCNLEAGEPDVTSEEEEEDMSD